MKRIRVGISMCLLGEAVRYDGGHKHDPFITKILGKHFEYYPVCPEVEIGLGIPRESIRLVISDGETRLLGIKSETDHTQAMTMYAHHKANELAKMDLRGYIFKKDSPSCGMERVRIYSNGAVHKNGVGIFAHAVMERLPLLPVEEEGRLHDPELRENFIERIFCYHRWLDCLNHYPKPKDFVAFHTRHKLTLLSHDRTIYSDMGRLVANAKRLSRAMLDQYGTLMMTCLKKNATRKKHSNVLYHLMGYLKNQIDAQDKQELISLIEDYRNTQIPLIVPITLLMHHFRRHPVDWVMQQTYLNPTELTLRNV